MRRDLIYLSAVTINAVLMFQLGYALLLHGHFSEAIPVWQEVLSQLRPELDSDARVMLAWASARAGRVDEARKLLERSPIPPRMAEPGLSFLTLAKYEEFRNAAKPK